MPSKRPALLVSYLVLFCSFLVARGQVIFTEVMFYPDTLANYAEFVEIFNWGNEPVDLQGWRLGDSRDMDAIQAVDQGTLLGPGQYAIILDPGYFDHEPIYADRIPDSALVVTIEDSRFGAYGLSNSHPVTLFLINPEGDTVQAYTYSVNNPPGISDEKIELIPDNSTGNWGNSRVFRGTPGFINSLTPRDFDLAIWHILPERDVWSSSDSIAIHWMIVNEGKKELQEVRILVFDDSNGNNRPDSSEKLFSSEEQIILIPGDSLWIQTRLPPLAAGNHRLGFWVFPPVEQDSSDNVRFVPIFIEEAFARLVINEILFEPQSERAEWIEIVNTGTAPIDLYRYRISDFRDTVTISKPGFMVQPWQYWVLCGDSSFFLDYSIALPEQVVVLPQFPTLNNDVDELTLFSPSGKILDKVRYFRQWYGRDVQKGTSLEKISPDLPSQTASSWAASVDPSGSTPTRENSVFSELPGARATVVLQPNPFSPDGDGKEDFLFIRLQSPTSPARVDIRLYDLKGRLIRRLSSNQPIGAESEFVWDGKDDTGHTVRIGLYIVFIRIMDNQGSVLFSSKEPVAVAKK